jgi:hypothetical protein
MIVEKQDAAILVPTKDSMRYFAIPEEGTRARLAILATHGLSFGVDSYLAVSGVCGVAEGSVGFAFYSREDSAAFQKCLNDWKQEREEMVQKVGGSLPSRPSTGACSPPRGVPPLLYA